MQWDSRPGPQKAQILKITDGASAAKKHRRSIEGFFQRTFQTPLDKLPAFVALLLAADPPIVGASVTIEQVVFTPDHLEKLLVAHKLPLDYRDHRQAFEERSAFAQALRLSWQPRVVEGFFMRAESLYNFATYLDGVSDFRAYGGRSLNKQSHGESFLSLVSQILGPRARRAPQSACTSTDSSSAV